MSRATTQWAMQTWDGRLFVTRSQGGECNIQQQLLAQHKRVMPRCPARLVRVEVVETFDPERVTGMQDPIGPIMV